ncbi:MAG TPA: rhodanese-like domain-containing protein [Tepidiformaceae bacterium]|nr:rhodanese-like domain-containing protein [Tepidiformaceae bacterium]
MRLRALPVAILVAPLAIAAACSGSEVEGESRDVSAVDTLPLAVPAPEVQDGLLIVSPGQVREWQESDTEFVLVDARDAIQYAREHIPGAINVPYVEIRAGGLLPPRDQRIVVYCSSETCPISQYAYEALDRLGYEEIYDMRAGLEGWKDAGHPTVLGADSGAGSR